MKKIIGTTLVIMFIIGIIILINSDFDFYKTILGLSLLFLSSGLFVYVMMRLYPKAGGNVNLENDDTLNILNIINIIINSNT